MAIAIDKANLGTTHINTSASTIAVTTTQAVVSNGFIVATFGWASNGVTLSSVADNSGSPLTWTVVSQIQHPTAGFDACGVAYAQAPSGLPSGTVITATLSASSIERCGGAMSFTGVATSTPVDTTSTVTDGGSASTAWSTGNVAVAAGSVLVTAAWGESQTGSTPSSGTEAYEANVTADTIGLVAHYRIEAADTPIANAGTWNTSTRWCTASAAFKAAAGGGGTNGNVTAVPMKKTALMPVVSMVLSPTVTVVPIQGTKRMPAPVVSNGTSLGGTMTNGFKRDSNGALLMLTSNASPSYVDGFLRASTGELMVDTAGPWSYVNGFMRTAGGALGISNGGTVSAIERGLPRDSNGALVVTTSGPGVDVAGFKRDASGRLVVVIA